MAAEKQNEKKKKKKKINHFEIMTRCSGESLFHPTDLHWCVFFFFNVFNPTTEWCQQVKNTKSPQKHTQQQHERRGGGKPTLRRMRQLISFRVNGEAGKGKKKKRSYQTFTVFLLTVYYLLLQMSNQRDRNWLSGISSVRSRITGRRKADIFES